MWQASHPRDNRSAGHWRAPGVHRMIAPGHQAIPWQPTLLLQRACACGGTCPTCSAEDVQPKLTVGSANDPLEHEADRVADQVMRMPDGAVHRQPEEGDEEIQAKADAGGLMQRSASVDNQALDPLAGEPEGLDYAPADDVGEQPLADEALQAKEEGGGAGGGPVGQSFGRSLHTALSGGAPMSRGARTFMESRFGTGFGAVRVHHDARADTLARSIGARAFTLGRNVFFKRGEYAPESARGRHLLAHELTHVVQQTGHGMLRRRWAAGLARTISRAYGGPRTLRRAVEVHVNLRHGGGAQQSVRLYNSAGSDRTFITSAGTGDRTSRLIRRAHYGIWAKVGPPPAKSHRWGLQYFAPFSGGVGFHSNIAWPLRSTLCADGVTAYCSGTQSERVERVLTVDGTPRSHGCLRLSHGNSRTLFNDVSIGTRVYVYDRLSWRSPSWSSEADRALPP
jgi:hypothetical protein